MTSPTIDFRTDFVSRPTDAMIEAMNEAARHAPAFGLRDDPFVKRLEARAAEILGKADSLFCPTCTMANQIAVHVCCRPGDNFITEAASHIVQSEGSAASALSGAMPKVVAARGGKLDADEVQTAIHPGGPGRSRTALIALENTHVHSGGTVMDVASMRAIANIAKRKSLPLHLDGSRIFNAAAALGIDIKTLTDCADTVSVSANKGLGAPLGAILAGDSGFIQQAVCVRQMFGGGWRPCSIPAAAALVAFETMTGRLAEDHVRARRLATALAKLQFLHIDFDRVQTNIVLIKVKSSAQALVGRLQEHGILVLPVSDQVIRMVTYHNIGDAEIDRTISVFQSLCP